MNSAWYAQSDEVKDQMWVGANFLQTIKKDLSKKVSGGVSNSSATEKSCVQKINVALIHHPYEKWHEEEFHNFSGNMNVLKGLCGISDIILTGHTHEISCDIRYQDGAVITGAGAVYDDSTYNNSFYLYELLPEGIFRTQYYYYGNEWCTNSSEEINGGKIQKVYGIDREKKLANIPEGDFFDFDKQVSAISYKSLDSCALKWYYSGTRDGRPIYNNISSSERVISLLNQFVYYDNKAANINDLFETCLSRINKGELLVLRGAQGTGKSTIISMLYIMALNRFRNKGSGAYPIYMDIHKYTINDILENMNELVNDLDELVRILKNAPDIKYIVFIDGIDEYASDSDKYEELIYKKLVQGYEERIVLCIGRVEDVAENRIITSKFSNYIDDKSMIIETKSIRIAPNNVDGIIRRFEGAFACRLNRSSKNGLIRWINQYSAGVIDFRTLLMLFNIVIKDETSVDRSLALNLESHLMRVLNISKRELVSVASLAVSYMMGSSIRNTSLAARHRTVIHKNKIIRDFLLSYHFVNNLTRENKSLNAKQQYICNWSIIFPRTVCRFISDMTNSIAPRYRCVVIRTLDNMYEKASEEMKINIGYILGRLKTDKPYHLKELLNDYIDRVEPDVNFSLYRTLVISLIYLQNQDAEKTYIGNLMQNPVYALEHLKLHCEYYYNNCEYVGNKGRIESSELEVLNLVIQNTKNNIHNMLKEKGRKAAGSSLSTDIITFCTALAVSRDIDIERTHLNEAQSIFEAVFSSDIISPALKAFVKHMVYMYRMQTSNFRFSES